MVSARLCSCGKPVYAGRTNLTPVAARMAVATPPAKSKRGSQDTPAKSTPSTSACLACPYTMTSAVSVLLCLQHPSKYLFTCLWLNPTVV
jgi:hypothetical protein